MPDPFLCAALSGLFGLLIGSFLNVCIFRWPRDLSVVSPRSRCARCEHPIAWYDNIPLLSYVLLRGRCRYCALPISLRYPIVEALTALCFAWFAWKYGWTWATARDSAFVAILITLAFADAETRILPDEFTLGGILAGFVFALLTPVPDTTATVLASIFGWEPPPIAASLSESFLGAIIPSGALWTTGALFEKLRHKEGLGFGDVKMMAMIGAFSGVRGALLTLVVGSVLGSVIGVLYLAITRKDAGTYQLPLGTFLAIGGVVNALAGQQITSWYLR